MFDFFGQIADELMTMFISPTKRIFIGYLLSALGLGVLWLWFVQRKSFLMIRKQLFSKELWLSSTAKTDYLLLLGNKVIMALISPLLLGQIVLATFLFEYFHYLMAPQVAEHWPTWVVMTLFTVFLFLLDDASRYLLHRWLHQSPTLWQFHRVHHTATQLTPFTVFRSHPIEGVLYSLRSALVQGSSIAIFVFLFGSGVDLITLFGINVLLFLFNALGSNLRHSPISVPYPDAIERWLISPAQHHIHHSTDPHHFNKNYGVVLAVWDRLGKTLHLSERHSELDYGIKEGGVKINDPLIRVYLRPFQDNFLRLKRRFHR